MVVLPSLTEQEVIAAYLDEKCAAINEIIQQAKATIEEYKEWKASVIFEAVTKGLDPDAEMKDSGVEWIGEIPKHWSCIPMKYLLNERNQKNDPIVTSERLSLSIDIGVTLYAEKTTNLDRFKEDVSQYKVAHEGDLVLNSMNMIVGAVGVAPILGCVSPAYYVFYDKDKNYTLTRYCDYIFKNKRLRGCLFSLGQGIMAIDRGDGRVNTCRLKVSRDDLGRIMLPCPPVEEQHIIISYLDKLCKNIDTIISEKQALIDELENYKKSLIFETVTGKRRVC
jgi:type I restriction enzyme S subunit